MAGSPKKLPEVGVRFGKLVTTGNWTTAKGGVCWETTCDCGVAKYVNGRNLRKGLIKSCGCSNPGNHPPGKTVEAILPTKGEQFGQLTLTGNWGANRKTLWEAVCGCGNKKFFYSKELRRGGRKNCGKDCKKKIKGGARGANKQRKRPSAGQRWGRLVATGVIGVVADKKGVHHTKWEAACDCGSPNKLYIPSLLNNGSTKSCGCLLRSSSKHNTRTPSAGEVYGMLTTTGEFKVGHDVIKEGLPVRSRSGLFAGTWAEVVCKCGYKFWNRYSSLKTQDRSKDKTRPANCGCVDYRKTDRAYVIKQTIDGAYSRGLSMLLTDDDIFELSQGNCHYCGTAPVLRAGRSAGKKSASSTSSNRKRDSGMRRNGIDRVDNSLGYIPGNVVTCCKVCNMMKRDLPMCHFISHAARISSFSANRCSQPL